MMIAAMATMEAIVAAMGDGGSDDNSSNGSSNIQCLSDGGSDESMHQ